MVQVVWDYSKKTEAVRLVHMARSIKKFFFQKKGFFVLPYLEKGNIKTVYFPDLLYKKIKDFWEITTTKPEYSSKMEDLKFIQDLANLIPDTTIDYAVLKKSWENEGIKAFEMLAIYLPQCFEKLTVLEIRPTKYGTMSSSYSVLCKDMSRIIVYVREDMDSSQILEAILIDFFDRCNLMAESTWEEREAVMDFLISRTAIKKFFPEYKQTIQSLRQKQYARLAKESIKYLEKLGFVTTNKFKINNEDLYIKDTKLVLPPSEYAAMKLLIEKRRSVVTYDMLADQVWKEKSDEKYSLYALAKVIERLRTKIEDRGVFGDIIQTHRGAGYMLLD